MQHVNKDIKSEKQILRQQSELSIDQKQQKIKILRRLLRARSKLSITDKDTLVRSTLESRQIVLLSSYCHIIFQDLLVNMADRSDRS